MIKYEETITNTNGDSLPLYRAQVVNQSGVPIDIYSDESGTPIVSKQAIADGNGFVEFFYDPADGLTGQILDQAGVLVKPLPNFAQNFSRARQYGEQPISSVTGLQSGLDGKLTGFSSLAAIESLTPIDGDTAYLRLSGRHGPFTFSTADLSTEVTADTAQGIYIAPSSDATGASGAWKREFNGVVYSKWFGVVGDGVTDDSAAMQACIDYVQASGGGTIGIEGTPLIGGLIVTNQRINFTGISKNDELIVKDGTIGIWYQEGWIALSKFTMRSQGTESDGLNTRGILMSKGTGGSTGHVFATELEFYDFSGYGLEVTNTLDFYMAGCFFRDCTIGLSFARDGIVASSFSTTVFLKDVYVITCATGIQARYVYRSEFNVIGEFCGTAIDLEVGDVTLDRCYFESNTVLGARIKNARCFDNDSYINDPATDAVDISFDIGVIPAADRGYRRLAGNDTIAKRLGLLSEFGDDLRYIATYGDGDSAGLKFGESTIPLIRGPNLLDPTAWASKTTSEFMGWDVAAGGYKIASPSLTGVRGMDQDITLDINKQYIVEFASTLVSGAQVNAIKVGSLNIVSGEIFTPAADGVNNVQVFRTQSSGGFETIIHAFSLSEVVEDVSQTPRAQDILTRTPTQRADIYDSAAPTSGRWAVGEKVYNSVPTAGGNIGWVCVTAGSPGTWKTFGTIEV